MPPDEEPIEEELTPQQKVVRSLENYLATHPEEARRITEQVNQTSFASSPTQEDWYWGKSSTGGEEDYYWRRLSDNWYQKDVIPSTYLEIHNSCYEAYNSNPLAMAICEMFCSFVLGKKITVQAKHKKVQALIDSFWNDPKNHMDERIYSICLELSIYGEQFIRFFVNKYDGSVYIRQIDPSLIDQIETDPEDIEHELRYHRRPVGPSATLPGDPAAVTPADDAAFEGSWFIAGDNKNAPEVVHFSINKVSNAKRGHSDLATLLPWLRRYKDWLTDRVRINKYKGAFLWDVELAGADAKTIKQKQMEYSYPPEPGSVIIHNQSEKWTAVQPSINANDAKEDGRAIKLMVAVGAGVPEHYLSDGSQGNQATAAEMGLPTVLKFQRRQKKMESILKVILDRVIAEAKKAGTLAQGVNEAYDIIFPQLDSTDHQQLATATNLMVTALTQAKLNGWVSDETAMRLVFQFAGEEINVHDEEARIEQDPPIAAGPAVKVSKKNSKGQPAGAQPAPSPTATLQRKVKAQALMPPVAT